MSTIHFVGGEKGGVGKSVLARLLAQYHIDGARPFEAFDSDRSHGALLRFYRDYTQPVALDSFDSADRIMESAVGAPRDVIVDLAAQSASALFRWIDDNDLLDLAADEGVHVAFWHVLDDGADGIDLLSGLLDLRAGRGHCVVVRNRGRGSDFAHFDASPARDEAERAGASIIDLAALHAPTMNKVDHLAASFWAAANNREVLGLMDRQRVKVWLRRAYQSFDALPDELFVSPDAAPVTEASDTLEEAPALP
jgi:hypothetical protein